MKCVKLLLLVWSSLLGCEAWQGGDKGGGVLPGNLSVAIDSYDLVHNPCQDVRLAGFICVDCATLGYCSYVNGAWQTVEMSSCQTERGFHCSDEGTFGCTWQPRCTVPVRGKFHCQGPGIYPDPYDCRSYHDCSPQNVDTRHQCTNGAGYSLLTHSCSLPRDSPQCEDKQYTCTKLGDKGVWSGNSSYYYVCNEDKTGDVPIYYPLMMRCNQGYVFNGNACVPPSQKKLAESHVCPHGLRFASDDPRAYFACRHGKLVYQACPLGYYFDAAEKSCLKDSQVCQEGTSFPASNKYGFKYCLQGELIYQRCPIKYYFDSDSHSCRLLEETCSDFTTSPAETSNGFYMCMRGNLLYQSCPPEAIFYDENRDVCFVPENV